MYKPADRTDGRNLEFVELYNSNPWPEDIGRYRIEGQVQYAFPTGTKIPAQGYIIVAAVPADVQAVHGLGGVFGPYTNTLKTSGELRLHDEQNSVLLRFAYDDSGPWPMGADGSGHSIVLARASYGEANPRAWQRSFRAEGSPGSAEATNPSPLRNVVLNEVLAHTDLPQVDGLELYNHGNSAANLGGCTLSDHPANNKFVIPAGTIIPARGFLSFTERQLGFALNAAGEMIYFKDAGGTNIVDALKFGPQENGISLGRYPNGADWYRLAATSFGASNSPPLVSSVGFNEIMYHPISGNDDDQFIELFNQGTNTVDLAGWKLGGGVSFTFSPGQELAPGGYLVVARNAARLIANYPELHSGNTVGNFNGRLSGSGERITLSQPDLLIDGQAPGQATTNHIDIVVDDVTYGTGGRWGRWSDGGGSSLELIDARADKRLASSWADSDETMKAPWTSIQTTARPESGAGGSIQIGLLDPGECLFDNVEVLANIGGNVAANSGFENGMSSLSFVGSHSRSILATNAGFPDGGVALHVRTGDGLMVGPNSVQMNLNNGTFSPQQNTTIRFKARWLRGCPEAIVRFTGCQLEATGRLTIPSNLGTPGSPNSQLRTNAGPAIYNVRHDPAVPVAFQSVVVSARVSDPDGLNSLTLAYRVDPAISESNVVMNDSGWNGDKVAGDGVFSGTIPGRSAGAIAFVLHGADTAGATSRFPELVADNAPVRECVIFYGEPDPTNGFGTYHLWLTQTNVTRWVRLPVMSNEDIDGTIVYNNRIIYNMGGRYSGSPWHQSYSSPAGFNACHYVWSMPKDDLLLGATSFNKIHWPGNDIQQDNITSNNNDATLQREQAAYYLMRRLGLPWSYRRFVAVYVNGTRRGKLMEDALRPTGGLVKDQYLPDHTGVQLIKLQRWYAGQTTSLISEARMSRYTFPDGSYRVARYRPNWSIKETQTSLSDYTNVFRLIEAAGAYNDLNYEAILENVVDVENWMRMLAANNTVGNWDAFGAGSGQNVDAWVSAESKWTLSTIDLSICLDNSLAYGGLFQTSETPWSRMLGTPKYLRMYLRALKELAHGPMNPAEIQPILDAKHSAFLAAGIAAGSPSSTKSSIANRRSNILMLLTPFDPLTFQVSGTRFIAANDAVVIQGTAPLELESVRINGVDYKPRWTSTTNWSLALPAPAGTNAWSIEARDRAGNAMAGAIGVTVQNSHTPEPTIGNVVFNEILFNTAAPEAEYIELFNRAATAFDLSGWTVNGIGYTFPQGSIIAPGQYLVLARSGIAFAAHHGALIPVFGTFEGSLQADGEILSLIQPGLTAEADVVVDRVRYESTPPWPLTPSETSLQLISSQFDNSRVGNWAVGAGSGVRTPGRANSVSGLFSEFPNIWLNEIQAENVTGPMDNFGEREPWVELYNPGSNSVPLAGLYLGRNYSTPAEWPFPAGSSVAPGQFLQVWLDGETGEESGGHLHASFRPETGSIALSRMVNGQPQVIDYLTFKTLPANQSYGNVPDAQPFHRTAMFHATPGATNNPALAPISVRINEWMAENDGGFLNPANNKYEDWFELHNPSEAVADLAGYYVSDSLANPFKFRIPAGFQVPAGGFLLVWADELTAANTNQSSLHVSFKLSKDGEALGLFTPDGVPIDAVTFGAQSANVSEARLPDSGLLRLLTPSPTPGASNIPPPASGTLSITELIAHSDQTLAVTFHASPGHRYRVEYKNDLADSEWQQLGTDQVASGASLSFNDIAGDSQRFYRIVRLSP